MPASLCEVILVRRSCAVLAKLRDTATSDGSYVFCRWFCGGTTADKDGVKDAGRTEERLRFVTVFVRVISGREVEVLLRGLPRLPEDRCGWSVSEGIGTGVLGGSALIFCCVVGRAVLGLSTNGVSEL